MHEQQRDSLLAAYGELQERLRLAEAQNAALVEREQRLTTWVEQVGNIFREFHTVRHAGRFDYCVRSTCVDARPLILAASPSAVADEPRTLCRCGRPLMSPGGTDPWCCACVQSSATCDCIDLPNAEPREQEAN